MKSGILKSWNLLGQSRPVTGLLYLYNAEKSPINIAVYIEGAESHESTEPPDFRVSQFCLYIIGRTG